jgi:hypothetical protein
MCLIGIRVNTRLIGFVSDKDMLMKKCVRVMQLTLRAAPSIKKRVKSIYSQRNLGIIKDRKREKEEDSPNAVRFLYSTLGVSRPEPTPMPPSSAPPDRIRSSSSRNNCTCWRRCTGGRAGTVRAPAADTEGPTVIVVVVYRSIPDAIASRVFVKDGKNRTQEIGQSSSSFFSTLHGRICAE